MAGAPSGAVASPDAASPTRGGVARKRRREADSSGHVLGATEDGGARAKRETSDPRDVVPASVPVGRGYPELCRGAVRDWPALRAWTRDPHDASGVTYPRLRELVGDREVRAMVGSERGRFDGAPTRHESVRITVSAFLDGACSEEPPNTTGVSPLCLAQIPVYDASASAAEAAETTISSAEKLGAKPFNKNAPVLQTLWDSGDVWPVPRVDATVTSGPESGGEPIRPRYVLDSANLWVSPGPIFEDANSSDAREKKAAVDDDVDGGFFFRHESSPHFDDCENALCVVAGTKTVRLWSPLAGLEAFAPPGVRGRNPGDERTYNHPIVPEYRVSADASANRKDAQKRIRPCETLVAEPGDAVYVPRGWWHAVASAPNTVAVNLFYRSAEDEALDALEAECVDTSDEAETSEAAEASRKRTVAAAGAAVAAARRATRALSEHRRRSFVRRLRRAAASDAFRERAQSALSACFRGDEAFEDSKLRGSDESRESLESKRGDPAKKTSLASSSHLVGEEKDAEEKDALAVLETSPLALALASPPASVLDALYDAAGADPASVERSKLAAFARRLRDASERLRGGDDGDRVVTEAVETERGAFHARVAAELLTSAFESHGDAFESRARGGGKKNFFETFYGAFAEEERRALSCALHALRSASAERSTLRVSEALGLADATGADEEGTGTFF